MLKPLSKFSILHSKFSLFIILFSLFFILFVAFAFDNPSSSPPTGGGYLQTQSGQLLITKPTKVTSGNNFIVENGNVGIGTTNPGRKLEVNGKIRINDWLEFVNGDAFIWRNGNDLIYRTVGGVGSHQFQVGTSEKVRIDVNGNVGIGTNSPGAKLEVAGGQIRISNYGDNVIESVQGSSRYPLIGTYSGWQPNTVYIAGYNNVNAPTWASTTAVSIGGFGSERLYVNLITGNVGIGTTSPGAKLEVYGDGSIIQVKSAGGVSQLGFSIYQTGSVAYKIISDPSNNWNLAFTEWATGNPGTRMVIERTTGNVGIGTTAPGSRLEVRGSTSDNTASALNVTNSGGTSLFYIRNDGNIGIGTTNPDTKLHIYEGDIKVSKNDEDGLIIEVATNTSYLNPVIIFLRSRGTLTNKSIVASGDTLLELYAMGWNGTNYVYGGSAVIETTAASSGGSISTRWVFDNYGAAGPRMDLGGTGTGWAVCHSTQTGTDNQYIVDCTSAPSADYAEMYPVEKTAEAGDLLVFGNELVSTYQSENGKVNWNKEYGKVSRLVRSSKPYENGIIGIVSDKNNITDFNVIGYNIAEKDNPQPVALSGRVLAKVSTENGPIKIGDPLTSSSKPGVAMRATKPGRIIGYALEPFGTSTFATSTIQEGKILVFVNPGFWPGEQTFMEQLVAVLSPALEKLGLKLENSIAYLKELITERIIAKTARIERFEMKDKVTGDIYCIWIERGDWQKIKGECR